MINSNVTLIFAILASMFAVGCAGSRAQHRIDALRNDPNWPRIRTTAETEIARRGEKADWLRSAYYSPHEHTNGVWLVVVSGQYPLNRMGDRIDILVRDGGEVVSYVPRWPSHPK